MDKFIHFCRVEMNAELRAYPASKDRVTLSDGSQVELVDAQVVTYQKKGKGRDVISYTVVRARRIRK